MSDLKRGGFNVLSLAGEDAILGGADRNGIVQPTQLFAQLKEAACDIKPKLIGLDTASDIFAGAENDRAQVRQFIGLLRGAAMAQTQLCSYAVIQV
jgi:RecA-family ATPase